MANSSMPLFHVVVTGAGRGLGRSLVANYLSQGAAVYPIVRRAFDADTLKHLDSTRCHPIVADLSQDDSITTISKALSAYTRCVDVLINNAGIPGNAARIEDATPGEVCELLDVHCLGAMRCIKAALPLLRAAKEPKVVNITSRLGSLSLTHNGTFRHLTVSYAYRIAKAAQNMLTVCLDDELKQQGIQVYAVHPGTLLTESGSSDANVEPSAAAERLTAWIAGADPRLSGLTIDLESGALPW